MSVFHENMLIGSSGQGGAAAYSIDRSLRFNSADSAYLNRTAGTPTSSGTWTFAAWIKRSTLGGDYAILGANASSAFTQIYFRSDNALRFYDNGADITATTGLFRDPSAWSHFVFVKNGTTSITIYHNGVQIAQSTTSIPSTSPFNTSGAAIFIGRAVGSGFDAYGSHMMADIYFIDGTALTPTSFGETDPTTGVWNPKAYTGSYGTNGFHLDFADNSSAAALGYDAAGSNDWTVNNLSVTAGPGNDSLRDSPTNGTASTGGDAGGVTVGNYCTWNPLDKDADVSLANGNLDASQSAAGMVTGSIGINSGKFYWEVKVNTTDNFVIGAVKSGSGYSLDSYVGAGGTAVGYAANLGGTGTLFAPNVTTVGSGINTYTSGDVIGVALNMDAGTLSFYKNGTLQGTSVSGLTGTWLAAIGTNVSTGTSNANFGQRAFAYAAPSGFKALCTANLPAPTIVKPSSVMDVVTYTGTGSALTPTSTLGFNPDLVWIKGRSGATDHALYDAVRGAEKRLESNTTDAEVTSDGGVTAFNSAGFSVGTLAQVNTSSATYASWLWDAGTSNATNTSGTITSTVRANASAGFSIVTYTGNATAGATVGHGLGVAPKWVIVKNRSQSGSWVLWVKEVFDIDPSYYMTLNSTAAATGTAAAFNSQATTSTVFRLGTVGATNGNGNNLVAYCWAPVAGYSAFGSYTGNGSSDGPFVATSMRPRWIMVKRTDTTADWVIVDAARIGYNIDNKFLFPNGSYAESAGGTSFDLLSNGFKARGTNAEINASGGTYVYACFAESPFGLNNRAR